MNRRSFLSAALIGLTSKAERYIDGSYVNEAFPLGHRLRDHQAFTRAADNQSIPVVIVGGGIAGLSAAWRLQKKGFRDFILLEMEAHADKRHRQIHSAGATAVGGEGTRHGHRDTDPGNG